MQSSVRWLAVVLVLFLVVLVAVPGGAAEKADAARIAKLVEQLNSNSFDEREQASKELEAIGAPAIDALKKAVETGDAEVRTRVEQILQKAEAVAARAQKKAEAAKLLAPRKVTLSYKETPVAEAVADFAKKSGYAITLLDKDRKLADRRVTLQTKEVSFWEAFDQFCTAAQLSEATWEDLGTRVVPGGPANVIPGIQVRPGVQILPALPARPAQDDKKEEAVPARLLQALAAQLPPPANGPAPAQAPAPVQARAARATTSSVNNNEIVLKDGIPTTLPTAYSGAVRFRALKDRKAFGDVADNEILVVVEARAEPRFAIQYVQGVSVEKAIDDQGQKLDQLVDAGPPAAPPLAAGGGIRILPALPAVAGRPVLANSAGPGAYTFAVRFRKGDKEARTVKELIGAMTAMVLLPAETVLEVEKILEASGKTVKGKDSGLIKVTEVKESDGKLTVKVEMEPPQGVVPGRGGLQPGFGAIQIMPIPPLPAPRPAPPGGGFFQVQAPAPPQPPVQVQIQVGPGVAGGVGGFASMTGPAGLQLLDDKGEPMIPTQSQSQGRFAAGKVTMEHTMTYPVKKDQKALRLVYSGSRQVAIDIPFTLKDVPVK